MSVQAELIVVDDAASIQEFSAHFPRKTNDLALSPFLNLFLNLQVYTNNHNPFIHQS